ncbi:MAG: 2-hydroxy-3-oxopropionate reductase [Alteromonadaceae bacterium]|jgi:3-hydroxyisobutyrate dehydrogenase|nr:2-hydroxy-3-oxopropionate reductase [Alteromonadaceae bacterium]MBB20078.1 2-hydroxy-3-oxopropionate reductase [Rickettsiales bacterium]
MKLSTAFIGLGVMGYPMAGHLHNNGYDTRVFNRSTTKAEHWKQEFAGATATSPREAATGADVVFICVGNDQDVRAVFFGPDGVLAGMHKGAILVDHTTTSADLALSLASACKEAGCFFLDAPVSGGQAGAQNGKLTVMCGGDSETFHRVKPLMESYAQQIQLLGAAGQGQRCKMVNQICIAGVLNGLSEALLMAKAAGLDINQVVDTLKHGAAGSWQMENRFITMAQGQFNFGFAIDWMRKDLAICLEQAQAYNIPLPMTQKVDSAYAELQTQGFGRFDTSALVQSLNSQINLGDLEGA